MSCCGKKRQEIRQRQVISGPISVPPSPTATLPVQPHTAIVFQGAGSYLVTGEYSRRVYHFSSEQPEQWIDSKDAVGLLRTGLFHAGS
jgi:hypothetical protein